MAEGLKLIIDADVTKAEAALKNFSRTAESEGSKAGKSLSSALNSTNSALAKMPTAVKPAVKSLADIGDAAKNSIIELKQLQKSLKGEISGLSSSQLSGVGGQALKKELAGVNAELKTLEKNAGLATNKTAGGFDKAFGAVRQLANILPGIGIAGLIGVAITAVEELASAFLNLDGAATSFDNLKLSIMAGKDEFVKAASSVYQLETQIDLAKKGFISKDAVVKQYNDTIGRTTGFVKNIEEAEKALQKNKDAYIQMMLQKAVASFAYGKAAEAAFEAQTAGLNDNVTTLNKAKVVFNNLLQSFIDPYKAAEKAAKDLGDEQKKGTQKAATAAEKQKAIFLDIAKNAETLAAQFSKNNNFNFFPDPKKTKQAADNIIAEANKVADYLNDRSIRAVKLNFLAPTKENEAANKKIARDFLRGVNKDFREVVQSFGFDFNVRPNVGIDTAGAEFKKNVEVQGQKAINALQKELDGLKKNSLLLKLDLDLKLEKKRGQEFAEALGIKNINSLLTDAQKQSIGLAKTVSGVLTPAFQDFVGAIVSGENPLKAFFQGIGQAVLQLIQKLIAAAIQAAVLSALVPGSAGVGGFKSIFKGLVGFAAGGIVSGPTLAMVGEGRGTSRSNPEIIAPLDQLRGMIQGMGGGAPMTGRLSARIRGTDLLLSNARTSRSQRRLGAG